MKYFKKNINGKLIVGKQYLLLKIAINETHLVRLEALNTTL